MLLSQERVLTLLYDKTFPPRSQSQPVLAPPARVMTTQSNRRKSTITRNTTQMQSAEQESMRQFNYGPARIGELDENDIAGLEREIDYIVRN